MVECSTKLFENDSIICCTFFMYILCFINFIGFLLLSVFSIVLLALNDINLLWINLLISIIITNTTNFSVILTNDKKKCNITLIILNSLINCILSTLTIINVSHYNYDDNLLYKCLIVTLISQYVFMVCDLFLINMHYICGKLCD